MSWEKIDFGSLYMAPTRNGVYKDKSSHGSGVKIVNMGAIFAYDFIGNQDMQRIEMTPEEMQVSGLKENDLLFARRSLVESGAGKASIVTNLSEPTTFESSIIRVRLNPQLCYPLFYLYWLRCLAGKAAISALVTGLNVKGIRGSELKGMVVDYPPIDTQIKIAGILKRYDDLIENNQKQIKLLEEAAQRLYKEWFVDLRFPGHETTPITDGIPDGWKIAKLSEVADVNKQSISKQYPHDFVDYVDLGSVSNGHIETTTRFTIQDAPGRAKRVASDGDIIWGMVRPNLKSYALVFHPTETSVFSTGFAVLSACKVPFSFLYCHVTHEDFVGYLVNCTNGAAYPAVKPVHFEEATILLPTDDLLKQFHLIAESMYRKIEGLEDQIRHAKEARDRLLPKLMNGEIEV